jgi:hypothetical protein
MVNGEQSRSQRMISLPFTVYCLPHALRSALSALRQGGSPEPDSLLLSFNLVCLREEIKQRTDTNFWAAAAI